ncbi:MAG: hypothetical protein SVM80_12020 [Halobacteriota archaeon]|nr:hypothetical protein [Halobacteriota archaeon]
MSRIRYLAAGLLCLTGIIHVALLALVEFEAKIVITVLFGVTYLVIGIFLFKDNKTSYYLGAIVPIIGASLGVVDLLMNPSMLMAFLIAIDAIIVPSCFYLIIKDKQST